MCIICKKGGTKDLTVSNDIKLNEFYDSSDDLEYCDYCGLVFICRRDLGKHNE